MSTARFIEQLYENFLGRQAFEEGKTYWIEQLQQQQQNAAEVTQAFISSQEFAEMVSPIVRIFYVALGRIPEPEGLNYWLDSYRNGSSIEHIAAAIVDSSEFKSGFSNLDDSAFLDQLYQMAFGRSPDDMGKNSWLQAIENGLSWAGVVLGFAGSEELSENKTAEIEVLLKYYGILNIRPEQEEIETALAANDPQGLITQLYADQRYTGEVVPGLTTSGTVIDGLISAANIFLDANDDGMLNDNESVTSTDSLGQFNFAADAGFGRIISSAGIDISTQIPLEGHLTAPGGSTVINPLTTLVDNMFRNSGNSSADMLTQFNTLFGFDSDLDVLNYNPIGEAFNSLNSPEAVQNAIKIQGLSIKTNILVSQIAALLDGAGLPFNEDQLIPQVYANLAELINAGAISPIDLSNSELISQLISDTAVTAAANNQQLSVLNTMLGTVTQIIANLNQAIDDAVNSGEDSLTIFKTFASIQIVAENIEDLIQSGANDGNIDAARNASQGSTFDSALNSALSQIGDVNGDGNNDSTPTSTPTTITIDVSTPAFSLILTSPGDNSNNVTLDSNLSLTFNANIIAGSGNIIISNGGSDTRSIDISDATQISISGNTLIVNPSDNLYANSHYFLQMASGVISSATGEAFAGISDSSTLNFKTTTAAIELSDIEQNSNPLGYVLNGVNADDETGSAIGHLGDINGDGLDDVLISSRVNHPDGISKSAIFVAYGKTDGTTIELSDVESGSGGFVINAVNAADKSGQSVSGAGDVNGDGIGDLIIGNPNGSGIGLSYLVFGKNNNNPVELSDVQAGTGGFVINGGSFHDQVGFSVSTAGDVNQDGLDDLIIGAPASQANGMNSGKSFVVFGKTDNTAIDLFSIDSGTGSGGFAIEGISAGDSSGVSVDQAGDVNGDGFDDVIIGAIYDAPNGANSGSSFVVFGKTDGHDIELSDVEAGTGGFVINGQSADDRSGWKVSGGGDVNGDGLDDILVSAAYADPNGTYSGAAYVVFGKSDGNSIEISNITAGSGGFAIHGASLGDFAGTDVSLAGDVNGDGLEDLIVGASNASPNGSSSGSSYVIYGKTDTSTVELSEVENGHGGFAINGVSAQDFSAKTVSTAGDVNGDGFADLIIAATDDDPNGNESGTTFVLFGGQGTPATLGTSADDIINGSASAEQLIAGAGNDTLHGNGGADVLGGGAGNDIFTLMDLNFSLINGGSGIDTLRFNKVLNADFTAIANNRLAHIEVIDLNNTGSTLKLGRDDILAMLGTEAANDLRINGTRNDSLNLNQIGLYNSGTSTIIDSISYWIYLADDSLNIDASVRLLVETDVNVSTAIVELSALEDSSNDNGFVINGLSADDKSGHAVSNLGDVNGDGLEDIFVSAHRHDTNGSNSGSSYVVFGKTDGVVIELSDIENATGGFVINGVSADDKAGRSLAGVGDVNGDGLADMLIGAHRDDPNGDKSGTAFVVFGKTDTNSVELSNVEQGTGGFVMNGVSAGDRAGRWVSMAGDVNADGFDDLLVGAREDDNNGTDSGSSFLVFGKTDGTAVELSEVEAGTGGFIINGVAGYDLSGTSTGGGGDINGDGLDDLIIGAIGAAPNGPYSGGAFVVFGKTDSTGVELTDIIGGTGGFFMAGVSPGDFAGRSVSNAGDVNGDGFDDVIVGAWYDDPNGYGSGASFVVFGKNDTNVVELSDIETGTGGFVINGASAYDSSGGSVSNAGDINGDGLDDLLIGADYASPNGTYSGAAYVVYGKTDSNAVELSSIDDGIGGFVINGVASDDFAGHSVSSAGDINGDGFDDLIVGAYGDDLHGDKTGTSFVIYGGFDSAAMIGTHAMDILTGNSSANQLVAGQGDDSLVGNGGADVLRGGAGNDILAISDTGFKILSGGTGIDTLRLDAALSIDFTSISNTITDSLEIIDLTADAGNSTLSFNLTDIIQFNEAQTAANNLTIQGNLGDVVNLYNTSNGQTGTWVHAGGGIYEFNAGALGVIGTVNIDMDIATNIL